MFESTGGDLERIEEGLAEHGYDAHQVRTMLESYYLPLSEQRAEEHLLRGGTEEETIH
jgi:hypothetical protein